MKVEHKVLNWAASVHAATSVGSSRDLELRLNQLGDEGWSTVAVAASGDDSYLVVLTRSSPADTGDIQLVQLAVVQRVRQAMQRVAARATEALGRPGQPRPPSALPR